MKNLLFLVCLFSVAVKAEVFNYSSGSQKFEGQFYKSKSDKAPAILVVHNWMGPTDETKKQALRFNNLGYNVFVADIYGSGIRPKNPEEAGKQASLYKKDRKLFRERIKIAYQEMLKQKSVNKDQTAILGYCFGGTAALEAARSVSTLKTAISFHGGLDSLNPSEGALIKSDVLVLHGADDPYVPAKDLEAFEKEMRDHKVNFELIKFSGAVHSFTDMAAGNDPSKGAAYNKYADEKSFFYAEKYLSKRLKF